MKRFPVALGVVVVLILVAVALILNRPPSPPAQSTTPPEIRIGVILPQTGNTAFIGESVKKGLDLGHLLATETNPECPVSLIYEDSAGDTKQAVSAYHKLRSVDGVSAVICVSTGAQALTPLAEADKVPLFCTAVSASGIAKASPWCFRFFISADVDAKMMGEYAVTKRGFKKLAVIYISDEMGDSYNRVFKQTVEHLGAEVVSSEAFNFGVSDFRPMLLKIAEKKPEAIYIQAYTDSMARIPVQMKEVGLDIPILSVGTISQPEVMQQAGSSLEGVVYTTCAFNTFAPDSAVLKQFVERFQNQYKSPPIFFEVFGYDTYNMMAEASKAGPEPDAIREGLLSIKDLQMASGKVSVSTSGEVFFPVVLRQIKNGNWAPLD